MKLSSNETTVIIYFIETGRKLLCNKEHYLWMWLPPAIVLGIYTVGSKEQLQKS